jgi:hypothetical protein
MNSESGSAFQKASFVLLVFIAGALAYLIVRERIRSREPAQVAQVTEDTVPRNDSAASSRNPAEMRTSFAPLRPRNDTNSARVSGGKSAVTPVNNTAALGRMGDAASTSLLFDSTAALPTPAATEPSAPAPGGFTRGTAAALTGRVTLNGTPPPEKRATLDPMCNQLHPTPLFTRHFVTGRDSGLANVFVYVKSGAPRDDSQQSSMPVLDNVACEFQPYVLGVRAGQPFEIRNSDTLLHNAHIIPNPMNGIGGNAPPNKEANLALPVRGSSVKRIFTSPEVLVKVKCDVHPWMFAFIGVVDHRWFTVTDKDGNFSLPSGLPPGRYSIAAVHPKAGESVQQITISDGAPPVTSFTLEVPPTLTQETAR